MKLLFYNYVGGLYFIFNSTEYLAGDTLPIMDVGDSFLSNNKTKQVDPGLSLVCVTRNVNTNCCSAADHSGSGPVGNWFYPDGTIVPGNNANPNGSFTRSSHFQKIRLNRKRTDVMVQTGVYTCEVPDGSNTALIHTATIMLCESNIFIMLRYQIIIIFFIRICTYVDPETLVVMITGGGDVFTAGANHSLTCTAIGGVSMTYTYQWLRYDGDIVNETSSTISFSPLRETDVGRYNCRVSDGSTNITSDGVEINVEGE